MLGRFKRYGFWGQGHYGYVNLSPTLIKVDQVQLNCSIKKKSYVGVSLKWYFNSAKPGKPATYTGYSSASAAMNALKQNYTSTQLSELKALSASEVTLQKNLETVNTDLNKVCPKKGDSASAGKIADTANNGVKNSTTSFSSAVKSSLR